MNPAVRHQNSFNRWRAAMRDVFDQSRVVRVLFVVTVQHCPIAMGWYPPGPDAFPGNDNERPA